MASRILFQELSIHSANEGEGLSESGIPNTLVLGLSHTFHVHSCHFPRRTEREELATSAQTHQEQWERGVLSARGLRDLCVTSPQLSDLSIAIQSGKPGMGLCKGKM